MRDLIFVYIRQKGSRIQNRYVRKRSPLSVIPPLKIDWLIIIAAVDGASQCRKDWTQISDACYYTNANSLTWYDAQAWCETQGGTLASIKDSSDNGNIRSLMSSHSKAHIGKEWIQFHENDFARTVLNADNFLWMAKRVTDVTSVSSYTLDQPLVKRESSLSEFKYL